MFDLINRFARGYIVLPSIYTHEINFLRDSVTVNIAHWKVFIRFI